MIKSWTSPVGLSGMHDATNGSELQSSHSNNCSYGPCHFHCCNPLISTCLLLTTLTCRPIEGWHRLGLHPHALRLGLSVAPPFGFGVPRLPSPASGLLCPLLTPGGLSTRDCSPAQSLRTAQTGLPGTPDCFRRTIVRFTLRAL